MTFVERNAPDVFSDCRPKPHKKSSLLTILVKKSKDCRSFVEGEFGFSASLFLDLGAAVHHWR
jgi:hypothetical protein